MSFFGEIIAMCKDLYREFDGQLWDLQQPDTYYPANADSLLAAQNARDGIVMRALGALPFPLGTTVTVSVPIIGSFEVTATVTEDIIHSIYQVVATYLDATKYTG